MRQSGAWVCTATQPHFQRSRARRLPRAFSSPPCRSSRPAANQSGAPAGHRALGSSGVSKRACNASMRPHKTPPLPHLSRALPPKACIRKAAAQRMRPGKLVHEDELMEVVQVLAKLSSRSLINLSYLDLESLLWSLLGNKIEGTRMGTHHHRQQTSLQTSNPTHPTPKQHKRTTKVQQRPRHTSRTYPEALPCSPVESEGVHPGPLCTLAGSSLPLAHEGHDVLFHKAPTPAQNSRAHLAAQCFWPCP